MENMKKCIFNTDKLKIFGYFLIHKPIAFKIVLTCMKELIPFS